MSAGFLSGTQSGRCVVSTKIAVFLALASSCSVASAAGPVVDPTTLTPMAGGSLTVALRLPERVGGDRVTWKNANVARFTVLSGGEQRSLLPLELGKDPTRASIVVNRPGPALVCVSVGPPEERGHSDSWQRVTHCVKLVLNVRPRDGEKPPARASAAGVTAKTGDVVEIQPLKNPLRLRIGDDLPVRVFYMGIKVRDAEVTATVTRDGSGGRTEVVKAIRPTDAQGTTWLRIHRAGRWVVRFVYESPDGEEPDAKAQRRVADLVFDVTAQEAAP